MKKFTLLMSLCLLIFMVNSVDTQAQKLKVTKGDLGFLKKVKELKVTYDYSAVKVGKFDTEAEYLDDKSKKMNKDEAGSGDKFKESWFADRDKSFHPKFEELFNKITEGRLKLNQETEDANYTLQVNVLFLEPGWNIGITKKPAYINYEFVFVDNASGDVKAKAELLKVTGSNMTGMDFTSASRLKESYALGGKNLAKHLMKKVFK